MQTTTTLYHVKSYVLVLKSTACWCNHKSTILVYMILNIKISCGRHGYSLVSVRFLSLLTGQSNKQLFAFNQLHTKVYLWVL